ncbi:MAG TPA: methylmalonyl-CoA mutase subunit beta [Xanthobacteraceae bacterium]|nr:methylmalonyl-CoA mutase subunit beta [Xanthobacteraceae bacterium]
MADRSTEHLSLAADFPAATREQWLALVERVLKGRSFETLVSKTYDDLRIEPLYARSPHAFPLAGRAAATPWQIMQRVDHPDPAAANAEALHDLENGATALSLIFRGAIGDYGHAVDASADTLARVLDDIHVDAGIALDLELSPLAKHAAKDIAAQVKRRGFNPPAVNIRFGFDPLGAMAHAGGADLLWQEIAPIFGNLIGGLAGDGFEGPFAVADGRVIHAAGGSEAQELAFALAVAIAYLRALEAGGIEIEVARRMLYFRLAADADQFLTTAKFRALRRLWARIEDACGLTPRAAFVAAETSWRMTTQRDPHVNMLRTTVAAFSAAVGGADAIIVLPFTIAHGLPDRFARRIARNTQLILAEEANLAKVADPTAGSGAMEELTDQLCRAAWALLQEIERAGGVEAALQAGLIQEQVARVRVERERAIAHRRDALTGTSEFPHLGEAPVAVLKVPATARPAPPARPFAALPRMRLAEPFERLRDASDRVLARTGRRPKIFLANLGRPSDFLSRANFASNFFEAGGIEAVMSDAFPPSPPPRGGGDGDALSTDIAALADAFTKSGAKLACLCASDEVYTREAAQTARALSAAGAQHLYLAGRPAERASLQAAGVNTFIYSGCDALATLTAAHDILGIGEL